MIIGRLLSFCLVIFGAAYAATIKGVLSPSFSTISNACIYGAFDATGNYLGLDFKEYQSKYTAPLPSASNPSIWFVTPTGAFYSFCGEQSNVINAILDFLSIGANYGTYSFVFIPGEDNDDLNVSYQYLNKDGKVLGIQFAEKPKGREDWQDFVHKSVKLTQIVVNQKLGPIGGYSVFLLPVMRIGWGRIELRLLSKELRILNLILLTQKNFLTLGNNF